MDIIGIINHMEIINTQTFFPQGPLYNYNLKQSEKKWNRKLVSPYYFSPGLQLFYRILTLPIKVNPRRTSQLWLLVGWPTLSILLILVGWNPFYPQCYLSVQIIFNLLQLFCFTISVSNNGWYSQVLMEKVNCLSSVNQREKE